ncbi:MAG: amidohydrolase family protein [Acidimicrobiia bacterium]
MKLTIVSVDGHAGPPVETLRPYLEQRYHSALDDLVEEEKQFLAATVKIASFSPDQLAIIDRDGAIASGGHIGAWDLDRRIAEMDREGIAAEVFLQGHQFASGPFFGLQNRAYPADVRMAGVRAFNRWQADMLTAANGRLIGVAEQTPVHDIDEIVREVHWAGEHGFRALTFSTASDAAITEPGFHEPYWEPVWKACADHGLALVLHVGVGVQQGLAFELFMARSKATKEGDEYNRDAPRQAPSAMAPSAMTPTSGTSPADDPRMKAFLALNYSTRRVFWELMVGGVFDRYPSINFIPTEARADWVPATLARMDARFEAGDTPLKRRPSEYWAQHGYAGASFIHRAEIEDRHNIGVRNLTFGRDYPHPEGTWPNTLDWLRAAFAGVPEDEARLILGGNAIRCYGLDSTALDAIASEIGPEVSDILGVHHVDPKMVTEFDKRGGFLKDAPELITEELDSIMDAALVG